MDGAAMDEMIETGRMVVRLQALCGDVLTENIRQIKQWGIQDHTNIYWLGILMEEMGEAAEAIILTDASLTLAEQTFADRVYQLGLRAKSYIEGEQTDRVNAATHAPDLGAELIQVAAVATAFAECRSRQERR